MKAINVAEVMYQIGIGIQFLFSNTFKKLLGLSLNFKNKKIDLI